MEVECGWDCVWAGSDWVLVWELSLVLADRCLRRGLESVFPMVVWRVMEQKTRSLGALENYESS